ncbi:hypothetical protein ACSQ67_025491 [Phaseolus vulgaris]
MANTLPPHHEQLRLAPVVTDFIETLYLLIAKNFVCPRVSNAHQPSPEFVKKNARRKLKKVMKFGREEGHGIWEEEGA